LHISGIIVDTWNYFRCWGLQIPVVVGNAGDVADTRDSRYKGLLTIPRVADVEYCGRWVLLQILGVIAEAGGCCRYREWLQILEMVADIEGFC
jgi:hypothetical protein